jgi:hypothetical protein
MNSVGPRVPVLCLAVLVGLVWLQGCHSPPPLVAVNLDGTWVSPQLGYDLELVGPLGVAMQVRSGTVQNGDPVFRIISLEGTRFTARQWLKDGAWHTVTGEWKDGKLYCRTGETEWVLEKKKQPIMP